MTVHSWAKAPHKFCTEKQEDLSASALVVVKGAAAVGKTTSIGYCECRSSMQQATSFTSTAQLTPSILRATKASGHAVRT
jgi:hypothetical protein